MRGVAIVCLVVSWAACGSKDTKRAAPGSDAIGNVTHSTVQPTARSGDVELTAGSRGGVLELTFRNTGATAIAQFATHVSGDDLPNYDWLELTLTDAAGHARAMSLVGSREKSGVEAIELPAGGEHVIRIDLAQWGRRDGNELTGNYRVAAVWDTSKQGEPYWHGRLAVSIDLTI